MVLWMLGTLVMLFDLYLLFFMGIIVGHCGGDINCGVGYNRSGMFLIGILAAVAGFILSTIGIRFERRADRTTALWMIRITVGTVFASFALFLAGCVVSH